MNLTLFLKERGYTGGEGIKDSIYPQVKYWYKKVSETVDHQYVIKMWPPHAEGEMPKFEIEMTYETKKGIWANTTYYGLSYTKLVAELSRLESNLKQALLWLDANPLSYEHDEEFKEELES